MKNLILTLIATLWFLPATAGGLTDMTDAERDAFRAEVRAYLLQNPEVLMEAIQVLEQRQQQQQVQNDNSLVSQNAEEIFNDGYSYIGGNPDGDVTLVEFMDYRCGYCRRAHEELKALVKNDGNIRLIVKEFPILGEQSTLSSQLAVATLHMVGPEVYRELGEFLITFNGILTRKNMAGILNKLGQDAEPILDYMDDQAVSAHIRSVNTLAGRMQIRGTPTFVLGDELIRGYVPPENMAQMVAYQRDKLN